MHAIKVHGRMELRLHLVPTNGDVLHAQDVLPRKNSARPIEYVARWASEPGNSERRKSLLFLPGFKPKSLGVQPVV